MKDDLEKQIEANFKNVEFNNPEEDEKLTAEEKKRRIDKQKKNNDRKKLIIIIVVVAIVLLLAIFLLVKIFGKSDDGNTTNNNGQGENVNPNDSSGENNGYTKAVFDNRYIYDGNEITDLEGNSLAKIDNGFDVYEGADSLYEVKRGNGVIINRFDSDKFSEVLNINSSSDDEGLITNLNGTLYGYYIDNDASSDLYILTGSGYKTIKLKDKFIYTHSLGAYEDKHIYDGNAVITLNEENAYGLYDVNKDKILIKNKYQGLYYLGSKKYAAKNDEKIGMIDSGGKTLIDFKYLFIEKVGSYYLAAIDENTLTVLDSNYKDLGATLNVPELDDYSYELCCAAENPLVGYNFNGNLIIEVGRYDTEKTYYYLDKDHNFVQLDAIEINIFDKTLVTKNIDSIVMYNSKMEKLGIVDSTSDILGVFINSILVLDGDGYEFYNVSTGEVIERVKTFRRTYGDYEVKFNLASNSILTISMGEEEMGSIDGVSFEKYIKAKNNGITVTDDVIIYNSGDGKILVVEKKDL